PKDTDGDGCVSFQEFFPPPPPPDPLAVSVGPMPSPTPTPLPTMADLIHDAREPLIARSLLKKYDRNRDLQLDARELGWSEERLRELDVDANGYLTRDETMDRTRFERELFDLIDADGDGKIFVDEMKQYVRARAEPVAATARVNVYDTGRGFFMALDSNADGRISERERRKA